MLPTFQDIHINPLDGGVQSAALPWLKAGAGTTTKVFKALSQVLNIASDKGELPFKNITIWI